MSSEDQKLEFSAVNWDHLLTHPSEFVRVDELLKSKQKELEKFNARVQGWNLTAAKNVLDHKRMILSLRCFLLLNGTMIFNTKMFSDFEYEKLKHDTAEVDTCCTQNGEIIQKIGFLCKNEFDLILSTSADKINTERFFRKIIFHVLQNDFGACERTKIVDSIIKKCSFFV